MFYRHLSFYRLTSPRGTLNKAATARAYRQIHSTSLFINGERRAAQDGKTFSVINPRTQEKVGVAAEASKADCLSAVDAAHAALPAWEQVAIGERSDLLRRAADVFTSPKYAEHIAQAVRDETDSSPLWAKSMCFKAANYLSAAAGMASEVRGSTYPSTAVPGALVLEQRRAMGVM
jgi:acyl-CoA reductase-like NAD-dependent aldehyde dehydrogenase